MDDPNTAQTSSNFNFLPPTVEALDALLPDFSVSHFVGQGGMGAVYRGAQSKLDRDVAIKILPKTFGSDLNFAARFEGEAKAMAKLTHNNIVSVFDYGETTDGALLFFCMEFVEGTDLHQLIYVEDTPIEYKINYLAQICEGLAYAHAHGIVHRDIKPENILINQAGVVKIADFGLAKVDQASVESGVELGTPDYMAPEVFEQGPIDHRADIFSMGVLTYEMLTKTLPTSDGQPASDFGFDERFDDIITKALSHDLDARFQNSTELKEAFMDLTKPAPPKKKQGVGVTVARRGGPPRRLPPIKTTTSNPAGIIMFVIAAIIGIIILISILSGREKPNNRPKSKGPYKPKFSSVEPAVFENESSRA